MPGGKVYTPWTERMLACVDVLVDGEFVEEQKDLTLLFRGSANQRLLTLREGKRVGLWNAGECGRKSEK